MSVIIVSSFFPPPILPTPDLLQCAVCCIGYKLHRGTVLCLSFLVTYSAFHAILYIDFLDVVVCCIVVLVFVYLDRMSI